MSGPMQWSQGQFYPAVGSIPNPTGERPGAVPENVGTSEDVPRVSPAKPKKPAPKNVVSLAKARLREVKKELRNKKALEKERDELERLIAAAENKPRAVVSPIKKTAG